MTRRGGTWRDIARPIIAKVLREHRGEDLKTIRLALREAYPFGERAMWPYKIWSDEVRLQLGLPRPVDPKGRRRPVLVDPQLQPQLELPDA